MMLEQNSTFPVVHKVLVFVFFALISGCMVNLDGGDWDGIQIVLGSIFHEEAMEGHIFFYRFAWQPLSYGIIRLCYALTGSVRACMYLPAIFGTIGITFLVDAMHKASSRRLGVLTLVAIVLLIPELVFGTIYMNTTVFGFAFAAAAMWWAIDDWIGPGRSDRRRPQHLLSGTLLTLACLCRFDFALTYPMFVFLLIRSRSPHLLAKLTAFGLGGIFAFVVAQASGMVDIRAMHSILLAHHAGTTQQNVFYYPPVERIILALIGINVFAWLLVGFGGFYVLFSAAKHRRWLDLLGLVPLLALLYPVTSITTPKYLVPLYMFLGLFLAWIIARPGPVDRMRTSVLPVAMTIAVAFACFLPARPSRHSDEMIRLTTETWRPSDDGPRALWGYVFALREVANWKHDVRWLDVLIAAPGNQTIVAPFDGWIRKGDASQPVLLHFVKHCRSVDVGPDHIVAQISDKKILLTEPGVLEDNIKRHFSPSDDPPSQTTVPLELDPVVAAVFKLVTRGTRTPSEIAREMNLPEQNIATHLAALQRIGVVEPSQKGHYQPKHPIPRLWPDYGDWADSDWKPCAVTPTTE